MKNITDHTAIDLLLKEPFFGHFLTHFNKQVSDKTETIAIDVDENNELFLLINENYWNNTLHKSDLKKGEIKHQLLHLIFGHLGRSEAYQNDELFGIAADVTINQFLKNEEQTFDAITLNNFDDLNLPTNKTLDFYYKRFLEVLIEPKYNGTSARNFLQKTLIESHQKLAQHNLWGQTKTNSNQKIIQQKVTKALSIAWQRFERNNDIGTLPQGLDIFIKKQLEHLKPSVNWQRVFRLFTTKNKKTYLKNTIRRPSKRYGTTPGTKIKKRQKILIAIDTSASITANSFGQFFNEIYHIWRQGVSVHIVECDIEIQRKYDFQGKIPEFIKGKGGTDFNAPIAYSNNEFQPDAIIYFTDGKGNKPTEKSRFPILWLIENNGKIKPFTTFSLNAQQ